MLFSLAFSVQEIPTFLSCPSNPAVKYVTDQNQREEVTVAMVPVSGGQATLTPRAYILEASKANQAVTFRQTVSDDLGNDVVCTFQHIIKSK